MCLSGAFRRTDRDEDVQHFVGIARQRVGPTGLRTHNTDHPDDGVVLPAASIQGLYSGADTTESRLLLAYQHLIEHNVGMFAAGLSHFEYKCIESKPHQ